MQLKTLFGQIAKCICPKRKFYFTFEIPPQEWTFRNWSLSITNFLADPDQGQRDSVCQRDHVLQGAEPNPRGGERGRLRGVRQTVGRHHSEERARDPQPWRHSLAEGDHCKGDAGGEESI